MPRPLKPAIDPASLQRRHAGLRLKAVRHMLSRPVEAMANLMGLSTKAYQAYESGQNLITPMPAYRLMVMERVPMEWLYAGDLRRADHDIAQMLTTSSAEVGAVVGGPVPEFPMQTDHVLRAPAAPPRRRPSTLQLHEDQAPPPGRTDPPR